MKVNDEILEQRIRERYQNTLKLQGALGEAMLKTLIEMGDSVTQLSLFDDEPYGKKDNAIVAQ